MKGNNILLEVIFMYILAFLFEISPVFLPFLKYYKTHGQGKFAITKSACELP